jgi:hypothetical protein
VWDYLGNERIGDVIKIKILEAHPQILIGEKVS